MDLDRFDRAILSALVDDARLSIVDLAPRIGLSASACARRLKALEEQGIVKGYHVALDPHRMGYKMTALVRVTLDSQRENALEAFEHAVRRSPSVMRCHLLSGSADYLLTLLCHDMEDFEVIYRTELSRLPHIARLESSFAMRDVVDRLYSPSMLAPPAPPPAKRRPT